MIVDEQSREWKDQQVRELYSIAITSRDEAIRHAVLTFLGGMERAGSKDAEWALDDLRKRSESHHCSGTSKLHEHKGFKT